MDLSGIRLFAFDFDGTLVQSNAIKHNAFFEVSAGLEGAADFLHDLFSRPTSLDRFGIFAALAEQIPGADKDALTLAYGEACERQILSCPEVPGMTALLRELTAQGHMVVINSATPEAPLRELVPKLSFAGYITATYGQPASKVENLHKAMRLAGVTPAQTLMVGDRESDRAGAEQAGCRFVGVKSDLSDFARPPQIVVERLDELLVGL